jgi:hypothetical protein
MPGESRISERGYVRRERKIFAGIDGKPFEIFESDDALGQIYRNRAFGISEFWHAWIRRKGNTNEVFATRAAPFVPIDVCSENHTETQTGNDPQPFPLIVHRILHGFCFDLLCRAQHLAVADK